MNLTWNPKDDTCPVDYAKASELTTYRLNPMPNGKYLVLCIMGHAGGAGTTNYNIGENLALADAQACAQTDWDKAIRP